MVRPGYRMVLNWMILSKLGLMVIPITALGIEKQNRLVAGKSQHQTDWGRRVSNAARWYLKNQPKTARKDCSGLVIEILKRAGVAVSGGSRDMWQQAQREGRLVQKPRPGDLAFFDNTYDANGNGKVDDPLTHVAVVVEIQPNGTILMVHRGHLGIVELHMNRDHPKVYRQGKQVLNDYLRISGAKKKAGRRLTAELFHGFVRPPNP